MTEIADVIVIGAGPAGLGAAYTLQELGLSHITLEASDSPGGLARSFRVDGYTFDCSGHLLHLRRPDVLSLVRQITAEDEWLRVARKSAVWIRNTFVPYPFQSHLAFAPHDIRADCIANLPRNPPTSSTAGLTLEQWVLDNLGSGIARHFMIPYNEKLSTVPASQLAATALGRFLPTPSIEDILVGARTKTESRGGYNADFLYPARGGIDLLTERLAQRLHQLELNARVVKIDTASRSVETSDGRRFGWRRGVISTAPLPEVASLLGRSEISELASRLRSNRVACINVGFNGADKFPRDLQWMYLPEPEYSAYRIGFYTGLSEVMAPAGRMSAYVEIAYGDSRPADELVDDAVNDLVRLGALVDRQDVDVILPVTINNAYVIQDLRHSNTRARVIDLLAEQQILSIGRYGRWEYSAMEDAVGQGIEAAQNLAV